MASKKSPMRLAMRIEVVCPLRVIREAGRHRIRSGWVYTFRLSPRAKPASARPAASATSMAQAGDARHRRQQRHAGARRLAGHLVAGAAGDHDQPSRAGCPRTSAPTSLSSALWRPSSRTRHQLAVGAAPGQPHAWRQSLHAAAGARQAQGLRDGRCAETGVVLQRRRRAAAAGSPCHTGHNQVRPARLRRLSLSRAKQAGDFKLRGDALRTRDHFHIAHVAERCQRSPR